MFKTFVMMVTGFVVGMILSENAQIIRQSVPADKHLSGNVNQFIIILGIGNSSNVFEINAGDETAEEETDT